MEATPPGNGSSGGGGGEDRTTSFGAMQFPALRFFRSPLSFLLDYSGILSPTSSSSSPSSSSRHESDAPAVNAVADSRPHSPTACASGGSSNAGEVSIRIIGAGEQEDRGSGEEATAVQDGGGVGGLDSQAGMDERVP